MKIIDKIRPEHRKYKTNPDNFPVEFILHHTGGVESNPLADTSHHTFETIEHWHVKGRGWSACGYHLVNEENGRVTQGRPFGMHGAHCKKVNKKSIGICNVGNFDATMPTEEQIESLREIFRQTIKLYPIKEASPHRKYTVKTCFGNNLPDDWGQKRLDEVLQETVNKPSNKKPLKTKTKWTKERKKELIIKLINTL